MKWTNARPDKDGFYWLQHYVNYSLQEMNVLVTEIIQLMSVDEHDGLAKYVVFTGTDEDSRIEEFNDTCFWYGPIEPPEFKL
jgi:hypothetical protein